jgi:hypothetical protein
VYNYHDSRAYGYKLSGILFWLDGLDGNWVELVEPLWNLCDYFVAILYDVLKHNLIGVVLTYNFNFRK